MTANHTPTTAPRTPKKVRVTHMRAMRDRGEKITMLTAYDALTASLVDAAGVDVILVGDSIGDNMLGHSTTLPVTVDEMVVAARAVASATTRALVVVDLPFGSYEVSPRQALETSIRIMKSTGAEAVKLEGGVTRAEHIRLITEAGIPVVGHVGFTPQSENLLGGKRIQGRGEGATERLLADVRAVQDAGAVLVVLEMVPGTVAAEVTAAVDIPTIGIGAGAGTDGQVLVWLDMAGMTDWSPSFARRFAEIGRQLTAAAGDYVTAVKSGEFPTAEHTFDA
ncbi:3-methyl-2-oxobutanoate hydroxymethyltransferase [Actinomycetales bacterium JB111]|nr:3-methyl-2-oxobutanoate hydroxymethyltransferase [Actinomycetales bacterium JB111]